MSLAALGGSYLTLSLQAAKNTDAIVRLEASNMHLEDGVTSSNKNTSSLNIQLVEIRGKVSEISNINLKSITLLNEIQKAVSDNKLGIAINKVKIESNHK